MDEPAEYINIPHWMWAWKVGTTLFCDWKSEDWPYTCSHHPIATHQKDGRTIGHYCREHIPEGVPVIDRNHIPCAVCGDEAEVLDRDGVWRCDVHRFATQEAIPPSTLPETTAS